MGRDVLLFRALPSAILLILACSLSPGDLQGQEEEEWNTPRALALVEQAREARTRRVVDGDLTSYSADARGYVYFFLHREDTDERILVKTDQIAVEVYWRAPDETKQRIVGLRDEKSLPTNIHYHLDHLVVVQNEFGNSIRIGDGDEVSAVVHPMAPGSEIFYDFALGDSLTITLPGPEEPVRVFEVHVRPKHFDSPGYVGSVFLDRATSAIVRMDFTFTPASYVDSYLDYIRISLDNGLWLGRHWLPYEQRLEIRREVPFLDIPAGSIIRGRFEISNYTFNEPLQPSLFQGPPVSAVPEEQRRAFPFQDSLHAQLQEEGLSPPPELAEVRAMAVSLAGQHYMSGLRRLRAHFPSISETFRYDRVEGLFAGAGLSYEPHPLLRGRIHAGYAFGRERPAASLDLSGGQGLTGTGVRAIWNELRDMGPLPGTNGLFNTLSSIYSRLEGVVDTAVGYMGGRVENPSYEQVCTGTTGHAEVVEVTFDPQVISYGELLNTFWEIHDPTQVNRQGPDVGTQYRSVIFFHSPEQEAAASASMERLQESDELTGEVATQLEAAPEFYRAEEYHQRYLEQRGMEPTCGHWSAD
ncbi:peptide-methionine (S)-S-oxide reductase MsrA [Gemmatimonadota bacterium]